MKHNSYLFILILIFSQIFATQIWKFSTYGAIEAKPIFFDDKIVIASYDGNIYYINRETGAMINKTATGEKIKNLKINNGLIIAASDNKIFILNKRGNLIRTINETSIYGFEVGDYIYIASDSGIKAYSYEGNLTWMLSQNEKIITEPLLLWDKIIFGSGDELVVANLSGNETTRIKVAPFWGSKPAFHENIVFIGSTENRMYAIDIYKNKILWTFNTNGWIMSNPIYYNNNVYFGSNDGNIYALTANTGALIWKKQFSEAVQGNLELFQFAGKNMLLFGCNDNHVYVVDVKTGDIILAFSVRGWVHNPLFYSDTIFFGSYDASFYAYTMDKMCSIDSLTSGTNIGYKSINISGHVFSKNSNAQTYIRINDSVKNGTWIQALTFGNEWKYEIDPNEYAFGALSIECLVSDNEGQEKENFPYVMLFRSENEEKRKMRISIPQIIDGKPFSIIAYDENGALLKNFTLSFSNKTFNSNNGSVILTINGAGNHSLLIRKIGFEDQNLSVNVNYDITNICTIIFTFFGIIAIAFYLFIYKRKR